jgi:hypothetical protein
LSNVICIYHGKCADGFTAAWIIRKALGDIEFYSGVYQDAPPDVTGKEVIMADFSYKRPVLVEMAAKAKSILILDHHASAQEDLREFIGPDHSSLEHGPWFPDSGAYAVFDMNRSGAGLTWDYFHPGQPRPNLVDYVEDRDLWRFNLPLSREVSAVVFSYEYSFENWDHLERLTRDCIGVQNVADMGGAIERKHHKDVAELVSICKRRMKIGGTEVWAASLPYTLTSDAGHLMAADGEPLPPAIGTHRKAACSLCGRVTMARTCRWLPSSTAAADIRTPAGSGCRSTNYRNLKSSAKEESPMPMVVYTEEELIEARNDGEVEGASRTAEARDKLAEALRNLVSVIDAAGLHNLSRGVELGPTVWFVKASAAMDYAKTLV